MGRPEVFTRQRLLNRRLTEREWLEEQLAKNTPTSQTMQGYRDLRMFTGLYTRTAVTFDPFAGAQTTAQSRLNLQTTQQQTETSALQHQIEIVKLQQQLDALRSQSASPATGSGTGTTSGGGTASSGSSSGGSTSGVATSSGGASSSAPNMATAGAGTPSASGLFKNLPELPTPEVTESKARITSVELFRDQLAWRNAVQAALREQELDDAHDLSGFTLYTLKFDLSVIAPPGRTDAYAKVTLGAAVPDDKRDCAALQALYENWFWHTRAGIHSEAVAIQRRVEANRLSDEESIRLATALAVWAERAGEANQLAAREDYLSLMGTLGTTPRTRVEPISAKRGAARLIAEKYAQSLRGLILIEKDPKEIFIDGPEPYYVPNIERPADVQRVTRGQHIDVCGEATALPTTYASFLKKVTDKRTTVFVADPKEQAQNISDVAAVEQLRNIVLSLQATLPQYGLNANNYTEYMHRSQERLQAILRRPVVVAYTDGGSNKFGWILGPRFEIDDKGRARFSQTTIQHSAQVSLLVPGWARTLKIPYETRWIDKHGREVAAGGAEGRFLTVRLPGDDAAVTAKLLEESGERRFPILTVPIEKNGGRALYRLQAKQPGALVVRGYNLWRNPKVFVGGQEAEGVSVLPDMSGLSVRLSSVIMPATKFKELALVDLTVVTSEGISTLREAVQIIPESGVPTEQFALAVDSPAVTSSDAAPHAVLELSAPIDAVPEGFSRITIGLRPIRPGEDPARVVRQFYPLPDAASLSRQGKKMVFQTSVSLAELRKSANAMPGNAGWVMQAEPRIAMTPGSSAVPIPTANGKPLLFSLFPNEQVKTGALQIQGTSTPPLVTSFNNANNFTASLRVELGEGGLFAQAFPGLQDAVQSTLTIRIAEMKGAEKIADIRAKLQAPHFELAQNAKSTDLTPPVIIKSLPGSTGHNVAGGQVPMPPMGPSAWLRERLAMPGEHWFKLWIVVGPDVEVPIEPAVQIKLP